MVREFARQEGDSCLTFRSAEGTASQRKLGAVLPVVLRDDVDGAAETLSAIDATCGAFQHLDALYVADADGEVCRKVSCLRIADVDAVEQQCDLVESAAVDADVRLDTKATALPDIHAGD